MTRKALRKWGLLYKGRQLSLPTGQIIVGRGSACDLILEDPLVSRAHSRLTVSLDGVTIEDLGSANGVFVNEQPITHVTELRDGDRILVGTQQMSFFGGLTETDDYPKPRRASDLLRTGKVVPPAPSQEPGGCLTPDEPDDLHSSEPPAVEEESTLRKPRPELMEHVVHEMLGRGQLDEATRLLDDWIEELVDPSTSVNDRRISEGAGLCLELAETTGRAQWVDRVFHLYLSTRRLMPKEVLDRLETLLGTVARPNQKLVGEYQSFVGGLDKRGAKATQELVDRVLRLTPGAG